MCSDDKRNTLMKVRAYILTPSIARGIAVLCAAVFVIGAASTAPACTGDCDGRGSVATNELILGVDIALGRQPVDACPAFANSQGMVDIAQLITGVDNALKGCGGESPVDEPTLQAYLDDWRTRFGLFGAVLGVARPGEAATLVASGFSDPVAGTPMDPTSPFFIASVTKGFVAAVVLQLAAEGVLDLDDQLSRWVPDWPTGDRILIRQLLNHTSGLPSLANADVQDIWQPLILRDLEHVWTPTEALSYIREMPLLFEPGSGYHYSNANYILAGVVVEAATGRAIADEIRTRLTEPLGLAETYLDSGLGPLDPRAGHAFYDLAGNGTYIDISGFPRTAVVTLYGAAGGMVSTPTDLLEWAGALYGSTQVLSREWREQMTDLGPFGYGFATFGLCPCETNAGGARVFSGRGHDGEIPGYRTFVGYWPDVNVAIVLYVNQSPIDQFVNFRRGLEGARLLVR